MGVVIYVSGQGRIQDLAMGRGGGKILRVAHKSVADPPPLRGFPEATIKVYTWMF